MDSEDDYLDASGNLERAEEFLPAPDHPPRLIEPFLHGACIAIELATKAAMKHGGAVEEECILVGHDLERAIDAAEARGFMAGDDVREVTRRLSPFYLTHTLRELVRDGYGFDQANTQRIVAGHLADVRAWIKVAAP